MYIPNSVLELIDRLEEAGYETWVVGGCVRDHLMGNVPHDYDCCTAAAPEQMQAIFADRQLVLAGLKHGTVGVVTDSGVVEITTFRTEGGYLDARHPDWVRFVRDVKEDLARRDFTVNAMAYSPRRGYATTAGDWNVSKAYETALADCKTDEERAELEAKIEKKTDENAEDYSYMVFEGHADTSPVSLDEDTVIGKYTYQKAPKAIITVTEFMRSVWGWILFVIIPLIALVTAEIVLRTKRDRKKDKDMDALLAELEALKAQKAAAESKDAPAEADTPDDVDNTPTDE